MLSVLDHPSISTGRELRTHLRRFVAANPSLQLGGLSIAEWVTGEFSETVAQYSKAMKHGRYGGALEMRLFHYLFGIPVEIFEEHPHGLSFLWETGVGPRAALRIVYRSRRHYDLVALE